MAFKHPIPAQIEAVKYFDQACKKMKGGQSMKLRKISAFITNEYLNEK